MSEIVAAFVGAVIGSVIAPIVISEYQRWRRFSDWRRPRKELLRKVLQQPRYKFYSIDLLARVCGVSADQCRELLIDVGARASTGVGPEKWALISRAPLDDAMVKDISE